MQKLDSNNLAQINGGVSAGTVILVIAGVIFIVGVKDGYVRPLRCN